MIRIFFIGPDILKKKLTESLVSKGATIDSFTTINSITFRPDQKPDLILIDKYQAREPSFKSFSDTFRDTPKIVFSDERTFRGFSAW